MKLQEPAAQRSDLDKAIALTQPRQVSPFANLGNFFKKMFTIAEWEVRKLRHDPTDMLTRTVQPALWLLIFGEVFETSGTYSISLAVHSLLSGSMPVVSTN